MLALAWLRDRATPPPMDLPALLGGVAVPDEVGTAICTLLTRKDLATEADTVPRQPVLDRFLAEGLADMVPKPPAWDREPRRLAADKLFQDLVLGKDSQGRSDAPRP